jgi:hypothetical protein
VQTVAWQVLGGAMKQPALIPDSAIQQVQTWLEIDGVSVAKFVTKLDTMDVQNLQLFDL